MMMINLINDMFLDVDVSPQLFRHSGDGDSAGFPEGLAERLRRAEAEVEELRRFRRAREVSGGVVADGNLHTMHCHFTHRNGYLP